MSKKVWDGEYDINTDWGGDESTSGAPLTGKMVQDVIKKSLKSLENGKVGYIQEHDGTVYFSSTKEAFDNEQYMGSVIAQQKYGMDVIFDKNNKYVFLSSDASKNIVWYFKTTEIQNNNKVYEESVSIEYHIENLTQNTKKVISTTQICKTDDNNSGYTKMEISLDDYFTNGVSSLDIIVKGLKTKQERSIQKEITIITFDYEDITDFAKVMGNEIIVTNKINCTLGRNFYYEYKINGGDFIFDESSKKEGMGRVSNYSHNINILNLPDGRHVLEYRLFLNINGEVAYYTPIQRIEFIKGANYVFDVPQILVYSTYKSGEEIISKDGNLIIRGVSQYVPYQIKYAVYNFKSTTTSVEFKDITNENSLAPTEANVEKGNIENYIIQSTENGIRKIRVVCKNSDKKEIEGSERIFYINVEPSSLKIKEFKNDLRINFTSVGKTNGENKDTWVSDIPEKGYHYEASFSETFDWSQGWTDNGLVITEGCEVEFNYAPFPQQLPNPTADEAREYVGENPYTFEIEFMTQNVTDETSVLCDMSNELSGDECGLIITGSEIRFTTPGGEVVSSRFKEGDMNRATIIIRPQYGIDKNQKPVFKGLVELYMNGILSSIVKFNENHKFQVFKKTENNAYVSKNLCFKGQKGADIVIKHIRAYNNEMSSDDVINNYIIYRDNVSEMMSLYNKNNLLNEQGVITPQSVLDYGNIPILIFVGRTVEGELASGCGNVKDYDGGEYIKGKVDAKSTYWYQTLEQTTDKKEHVDMDVIYYNPLDKLKNFKFVKAYITPQGTSSMYYPKKNYRIYTQKNDDTRLFFTIDNDNVLELKDMLKSDFGETEEDRRYEKFRGTDSKVKKKKLYSFKDNAQPVKCWCLKADFAETSSSHNTGIARLWGDTLKKSTITLGTKEYPVFKTTAQSTIEKLYDNDSKKMPDIRTTIDGFPIVVFGMKSYGSECVFLGKYNFNNDKSTESVFGFCDIDNNPDNKITDDAYNYDTNIESTTAHTLDAQLDQYMTCVETLDNGNALANFSSLNSVNEDGEVITWDESWEDAFEFRYPEIPEAPNPKDYQYENGSWKDLEGYNKDLAKFENEKLPYWKNTHLKPFRHFSEWVYSTRWCDVNGNILRDFLKPIAESGSEIDENGKVLTTIEEVAAYRQRKFSKEKWDHLDVWKMAAYYIYAMRFGAVDQIVKNSMLTSEGPFAYNATGGKYGVWDSTDVTSPSYGQFYKWYYINYDNDTIMGVKNDGRLVHGPEITRQSWEEGKEDVRAYAGWDSTLWNNFDTDSDFQNIVTIADRGISRTMTYDTAINMFENEQVGKWCERIYNKDADYKYISPYKADWSYSGDTTEVFSNKLFMLQGSRTSHRRWWLSRRFNLFDGKWSSGDFAKKYVEVKCDYGEIGNTFNATAGANAYFGYQINNRTFGNGAKDGGTTHAYSANEIIPWKLYKVINIGDPIAIYGSTDILELCLSGISKNLSSVSFQFGSNKDLGNKLESLILSIPENDLLSNAYYRAYGDDDDNKADKKTAFEKLQKDFPFEITDESLFDEGGKYPTTTETLDVNAANSPKFYRLNSFDGEKTIVIYFAKIEGGVRNYSCGGIDTSAFDKLQTLSIAGFASIKELDLTKNTFINTVDIRYTGINKVDFCNGSRIKMFKATDALTSLNFVNSDNITLSNIFINSTPLSVDGGKNISVIEVDNSKGLNKSNDFKDFIINWMKIGEISAKQLELKNIKWTGVKMRELEVIKQFIFGNETTNKALKCIITGTIEMGSEKFDSSDIEMFEEITAALGGSLTIKIPNANIVLNANTNEIIAGETATYTYTLFPNAETILNDGGTIDFSTVVECDDTFYDVRDIRYNKYYKIVKNDDIRKGLNFVKDSSNNSFSVTTEENVCGVDTTALIMARLTYKTNSTTLFDIAPLTIKEPTYAVEASIRGPKNLGELNTTYSYNLSMISNNGDIPLGSINIEWEIIGDDADKYFSKRETSKDGRTFTLTTSSIPAEPTAILKLRAKIINNSASQLITPSVPLEIIVEKDLLLLHPDVVLTVESNPTVFNICKAQGWIKNDLVMTKSEAESVEDLGTIFSEAKSVSGWSFEELIYFTNPKLTTLSEKAFYNSDLISITLPKNITKLGVSSFEECKKLKTIQIDGNITEIPERCFLNCNKLTNFILPDTVEYIRQYSFGGTGIERIIEKTDNFITGNRTILLTENSNLLFIDNGAFETNIWTPETTTNRLIEIVLPPKINLADNAYDFTLSKYLTSVRIINEEDSSINVKDNLLIVYDALVRAIPKSDTNHVYDEVVLDNIIRTFNYSFYACETINTVVIGSNIEEGWSIGKGTFYESQIVTIDLSKCSELIGISEYAFNKCTKLENIIFPTDAKLQYLGRNLFSDCHSLSAITLPNTLIECVGDSNADDSNTFINCALKELVMPQSLVKTGRFFIKDCNELTRIVFSDFYTSIGSGGSDKIINCASLEEIVLPIFYYTNEDGVDIMINSYLETGNPFFSNCPNIKRLILNPNDNGKLYAKTGEIFYKIGEYDGIGEIQPCEKTIVFVPPTTEALVIDEDTFIIGNAFLKTASKITSVNIPHNVHTISSNAFKNSNIVSIEVPDNVHTIGEKAFTNCSHMERVVLSKNIVKIPTQAFDGCVELKEVILMGEVELIETFAFRYCSKLETLTILSSVAPLIGSMSNTGYTEYVQYHPFGYRKDTYVGVDSNQEINYLYVPYNNSKYDTPLWETPLQLPEYGRFKKEKLRLSQEAFIIIYDAEGNIIDDKTVYFESESGEFVWEESNTTKSSTYNVSRGGYVVNFNNTVYHGEMISVFSDVEKTNLLGTFIAELGVNEYIVGGQPMTYASRSLFSTGLFNVQKPTDDGDEPVTITKSEYEMLVSKINQLTEIVNNLK